jgi:hypothetical protein
MLISPALLAGIWLTRLGIALSVSANSIAGTGHQRM